MKNNLFTLNITFNNDLLFLVTSLTTKTMYICSFSYNSCKWDFFYSKFLWYNYLLLCKHPPFHRCGCTSSLLQCNLFKLFIIKNVLSIVIPYILLMTKTFTLVDSGDCSQEHGDWDYKENVASLPLSGLHIPLSSTAIY